MVLSPGKVGMLVAETRNAKLYFGYRRHGEYGWGVLEACASLDTGYAGFVFLVCDVEAEVVCIG